MMTRTLLLCAALAACGESKPAAPATSDTPLPTRGTDDPAEIKVPTTGVTQLQGSHDAVRRELKHLEARKADGKPLNAAVVKSQIELVDQLIVAAKLAIDAEAMKQFRTRVGKMRQDYRNLELENQEISNEIREIKLMLEGARKGVEQLPEGYTETELMDRVGELEVKVGKIREQKEEFAVELSEQEALLANQTPPPLGDSIWTRELADLKETRARLESLGK